MESPNHEACCKISIDSCPCPCPVCGNAGRKVRATTLDHHVPKPLRAAIGNEATFCLNHDCDVVYCNPKGVVIRKGETVLPVTQKDPGDDVHVCYCFGFKRSDIRRDLASRGTTEIPDRIKHGIAEGRCACEQKNPQGVCCLGNVDGSIKKIQELIEPFNAKVRVAEPS